MMSCPICLEELSKFNLNFKNLPEENEIKNHNYIVKLDLCKKHFFHWECYQDLVRNSFEVD
jgi:hypothetical protein